VTTLYRDCSLGYIVRKLHYVTYRDTYFESTGKLKVVLKNMNMHIALLFKIRALIRQFINILSISCYHGLE
jgi:hypothetical protein